MNLSFAGSSFIGRRRSNQDSILTLEIDRYRNIYFFAVADGMGGYQGGDIASSEVMEELKSVLTDHFSEYHEKEDLKIILSQAIKKANNKLQKIVNEKADLRGMGTTLACVLTFRNEYVIGNIGDSRIYYYDCRQFFQLTTDHSEIENMKESYSGKLDPYLYKQYGHIITRVLQGYDDQPDIYPNDEKSYEMIDHSGLIICSDGMIADKSKPQNSILHRIIIGSKKNSDVVQQLIKYAYYEGSTDNISVISVRFGKFKTKRTSKFRSPTANTLLKKRKIIGIKTKYTLSLILIISILALSTYLLKTKPLVINEITRIAADYYIRFTQKYKNIISKQDVKYVKGENQENILNNTSPIIETWEIKDSSITFELSYSDDIMPLTLFKNYSCLIEYNFNDSILTNMLYWKIDNIPKDIQFQPDSTTPSTLFYKLCLINDDSGKADTVYVSDVKYINLLASKDKEEK